MGRWANPNPETGKGGDSVQFYVQNIEHSGNIVFATETVFIWCNSEYFVFLPAERFILSLGYW